MAEPVRLRLSPTQNLNLRGDRSIDANHLSAQHREWVESLPGRCHVVGCVGA
ncbi:hypothetical protein [Streptomyces sp. NBC_00892]|uniref:hypothetical protein n=1 Tax=Streptomyces sp. NBC_00892 TaxID=2975861 RepID=UPI002253F189|nr:hypothetical protein [Streptomyces sp. NBC_00892]MCX4902510.1 hypothetical protein [Streptomyces sp. NBC_00892]